PIADGEGFSLTAIDPGEPDTFAWGEKDFWRASANSGGSPGRDDSGLVPDPGAVVINEIMARPHDNASDWIELYNTTDTAIDIGGWYLSDSTGNPAKYRIASGTALGPNEYLVFQQDLNFGNVNDLGCHVPFALSASGERVYISSGQNGELTGYRSSEDFGASETGISFGRYYDSSTDNYNFVAMARPTPGAANSEPKVGPIVISEIMYNPDWPADSPYTDEQYEYIELHNITGEPVTLYDHRMALPWKFTDGIEYTFPIDPTVTIPVGGFLLLARDPVAFAWRYPGVPADMVLGPYDGKLSNSGEKLELSAPGTIDGSGELHYIRIDIVDYSDGFHPQNVPGAIDMWPMEPDGNGSSLTREILTSYGNDPDNWIASSPSPGS
ncbi:MAG: lamin tail domain-containing protein, partial [Phycisphaerales bacterium]